MALSDTLTLSTLDFLLSYRDAQSGSKRVNVSRGVNLSDNMLIKHQTITDKKTSVIYQQDALIIQCYYAAPDGSYLPLEVTLKVKAPVIPNVDSTAILRAVEFVAQVIQEDDSGIDKASDIFVSRLQ